MLSQELKTALCGITELQVPDIAEIRKYYLHGCFSDSGRMLSRSIDGEDNIHPYSLWEPETEPKANKVVNN
ncbi:hypothetical protein TNCV_2005051 [Trichonephila clavipes]|nr:hypothetical protein TNCV_2005051 [Trichonephila clavipes]